jgi:hypothetical protein
MKDYTVYCPECGCDEYTNDYEGMEASHRICDFCKQEYFTDVKYSPNQIETILKLKLEIHELKNTIEKMKCAENCANLDKSVHCGYLTEKYVDDVQCPCIAWSLFND